MKFMEGLKFKEDSPGKTVLFRCRHQAQSLLVLLAWTIFEPVFWITPSRLFAPQIRGDDFIDFVLLCPEFTGGLEQLRAAFVLLLVQSFLKIHQCRKLQHVIGGHSPLFIQQQLFFHCFTLLSKGNP